MALAIVLIVLVLGSVLFHLLSPWYFNEIASNWGMIDTTIDITFWVTGIVFVTVNLFMAYAIIRYRHQKGKDQKAAYDPENKKLEIILTVITAIGVAAMLAPGLVVWGQYVEPPEDAAPVEVIGQQWTWAYRFPGADGVLGTVDLTNLAEDNPFGMNLDDPNGRDDILINSPELHLPVDQPVRLLLRSNDVLHNFTVAEFRAKMDLVPGMVTYMWLTPTRVGKYDVLCEELCGMGHFLMRGSVTVDTQEDFDSWLAGHPTYADTLARPAGNPIAGAAAYAVCSTCHGADGLGIKELNAPKLTGQKDWYMRRQLEYYKQGIRGTNPEDTYGQQMAPMAMTLVDDQAIDNVIAYINSLSDAPAPTTLSGDVARGAQLYDSCRYCHGNDGGGVWSAHAPRLAGISDWYLVQQLQNYRQGIRGQQSGDVHGHQMVRMAKVLRDDAAINDLVAYINTLQPTAEAEALAAE